MDNDIYNVLLKSKVKSRLEEKKNPNLPFIKISLNFYNIENTSSGSLCMYCIEWFNLSICIYTLMFGSQNQMLFLWAKFF